MWLAEAQEIIREVHGKGYTWLFAWGLGWVRDAVRTIEDCKSATDGDKELAQDVRRRIVEKR